MTTLLFSGALVSRLLGHILARRREDSSRKALVGVSCFLAALLLIAGPYWWSFGKDIWQYFWNGIFGPDTDCWMSKLPLSESLLYYLAGAGFHSNVAFPGIVICLLAIGCTVFLVLRRPELRWKIFVLFACIAGAYAVNSRAELKSPFLGGGMYGVWLFGSAFVVGETYDSLFSGAHLFSRKRAWATALLGACFLAGLLGYQWPAYSFEPKDIAENYRAANDHMFALLERYKNSLPQSIFFAQTVPIIPEDTETWFAFHNQDVRVETGILFRTPEHFKAIYPNFKWLVIQEKDVKGTSPNFPVEGLLPSFLEIVRADDNYKVISEFTALNGKKVWIYARK
jgi:hypothetical protein